MIGDDQVEFYLNDKLYALVKSSIIPSKGDLVWINGKIYEVTMVVYRVETRKDNGNTFMRACIDIIP